MNKLKYIYYSIYYNFYKILKKIDSDETPQTGALFLLVILETLNLLVLLTLFSDNIFSLNLEWISNNSRLTSLPGFVFLTGANYFIFLRGKRYLKIEWVFSEETNEKKKLGNFIAVGYLSLSIISFIYFVIY